MGSLSIWPDEDDQFNKAALNAYPAFLPMADRVRLERLRQARMLFDGRHEQYFLGERRTRFSFRQVRTEGGNIRTLYLTFNILRLVSLKAADLLMGEPPLIDSTSPNHAEAIDNLADRTGLHQVLYQAAADASAESEAFLEAVIFDNQVYIQQVDAAEVFPQGPVMPDGQHAAYLRRQVDVLPGSEGVTSGGIWLLLETTYRPGSIERHCWQLDDSKKKVREVALDQWPAYTPGSKSSHAIPQVQATGIAWNTMVWVPNLILRKRAVSDYDGGVVSLQDTFNAKCSQLAVVLLKHAQPKLLLPDALGTSDAGGGGARASDEVFYTRQGDPEPRYVTWDAQLDAAQKDRAFSLNQLLVQTETSPVLLGLKEGAAPDAYRKVRLEAFNSLTKAARRSVYWTQGIRTILTVASMLEQTISTVRPYELGDISVELRDGIPVDAVDRATELATLRSAGLKSVRKGLEELLGDPAAVDEEKTELDAEAAAATPSVLFGEPAPGSNAHGSDSDSTTDEPAATPMSDEQSDAVVSNDLRATVGGSTAIRELQTLYYDGGVPREAAMANARIVFGFTQAEAEDLFPDIAPDAPGDDNDKQTATATNTETQP